MNENAETKLDINNLSLIELINKSINFNSDKIAIYFQDDSISYSELGRLSDNLSKALILSGVKSGDLVGISTNRNIGMIVSIIATLKCGAGYVPMDPTYPKARLHYIANISKPKVMITENEYLHVFDGLSSNKIVVSPRGDFDNNFGSKFKSEELNNNYSNESIAYVIFTSGSTGNPKGVQVQNSAVVNFVCSMLNEPGICANDVLLAVTTISFDIHVLEIFCPLVAGGSLVMASKDDAVNGWNLVKLIQQYNVSIMQATPMTWRLLFEAGLADLDMPLKALVGGEALPEDLCIDLYANSTEVWNMYGPTETTVWSTCYQIKDINKPILIGNEIANTQLYVVDSNNNIVPNGVPGELLIGGKGVTLGYINRDDLTRDVFIENIFSSSKSTKLYRTGDLVVRQEDGNLKYLNRLDTQVKIRGFRIELGEIENAMLSFEKLKSCVVNITETGNSTKQIVAYYISDDNTNIKNDILKSHLEKQLPEYMVPHCFVRLDEFPLTENRKIDRKALPMPNHNEARKSNDSGPISKRESQIAEIWKEALGVEEIGINDSFAELGGDSLTAMRVLVKMKSLNLDEKILRGMFQGQSIRNIATLIDSDLAVDTDTSHRELFKNPAKINAASMSILRTIVILLVVASHWSWGVFERLPSSFDYIHTIIMPFFNMVTPGFSIVFGISMGYIFYPIYILDKKRASKTLHLGALVLLLAMVLESVMTLLEVHLSGNDITQSIFFSSFYSAITYYFLALWSMPLWFQLISKFKNTLVVTLSLSVVSLLIYQALKLSLNHIEFVGFLQLLKLMLVAKFNYFNMSVGVFVGISFGYWLKQNEYNIRNLNKLYFLSISLMVLGAIVSVLTKDINSWITPTTEVVLWKWLFYSGVSLILALTLIQTVSAYGKLNPFFQSTIRWSEMVGQAVLPIWIMQGLVLDIKNILDLLYIPDILGTLVILLIFFGVTIFLVRRLYRMYYG